MRCRRRKKHTTFERVNQHSVTKKKEDRLKWSPGPIMRLMRERGDQKIKHHKKDVMNGQDWHVQETGGKESKPSERSGRTKFHRTAPLQGRKLRRPFRRLAQKEGRPFDLLNTISAGRHNHKDCWKQNISGHRFPSKCLNGKQHKPNFPEQLEGRLKRWPMGKYCCEWGIPGTTKIQKFNPALLQHKHETNTERM